MTDTTTTVPMTCGHMSDGNDNCPNNCPDSKPFVEDPMPELSNTEKALGESLDGLESPLPVRRNYLQETLAAVEAHFTSLAVLLQHLRHEMEIEYGLQTLTSEAETE